MKTLEQINALLEVLDSDNASLIDELQKLKADIQKQKGGVYVPKAGEHYWSFRSNIASVDCYLFQNDAVDRNVINHSLVYRTQEEAERARDKKTAEVRYIRLIAEANDGWWPDWKDENQGKWIASYDYKDDKVCCFFDNLDCKDKDSCYYSKSQEALKCAVAKLTEEEIELIFKS